MKCPVDKSRMIVVEHRNIEVDYCTKCSGVWLDSGELELLVDVLNAAGANLSPAESMVPVKADVDQKKRRCPICNRKMDQGWLGDERKVLIDSCPLRHGFWFDKGELQNVLKGMVIPGAPSSADVISFLGESLQADYKQQANR
jgi:uncharacterized protein